MLSTQFRSDFVMAGSGSDAGKFIGDNTHPDSSSANQNTVIGVPPADFQTNLRGNVRIINRFPIGTACKSKVELAVLLDMISNKLHDLFTAMIAADNDSTSG